MHIPHDFVQALQSIPFMAPLVTKAEERWGERFTKFMVNGSLAAILIATIGWAFSIENRMATTQEQIESIESETDSLESRLKRIDNKQDRSFQKLQSIEDHVTGKYHNNGK